MRTQQDGVETARKRSPGARAFSVVWFGQLVSMLGTGMTSFAVNFAGVFQWVLQSPMILARTGQDSGALGVVLSAAGIGSVIGGLGMSAWGLITYRGFTILHLGDAQGDISRIDQEDVRQHLKEIFSAPIDLLLVPIGWTRDIIKEAEATVALLQPRRVIPIHYWSPQKKRDFLAHLAAQNEIVGASYQVQEVGGAEYDRSWNRFSQGLRDSMGRAE